MLLYCIIILQVGIKWRVWSKDTWSVDCKPLFRSLPEGQPPMEYPNYGGVNVKLAKKKVYKMGIRGKWYIKDNN